MDKWRTVGSQLEGYFSPKVGVPMIGNLLDFAGGLISSRSQRKERARDRAESRYQFDQQMDYSIRRRIADAQAAGIHPLFALGASVGASPTISSGGVAQGGALGEAVSRIGSRMANAQIARDEAEAQLLASRAKQIETNLASRGRDGLGRNMSLDDRYEAAAEPLKYGPGWVQEPNPIPAPTQHNPALQAGEHPTLVTRIDRKGRKHQVLAGEMDDVTSPAFVSFARSYLKRDTLDAITKMANDVNGLVAKTDPEYKRMKNRMKMLRKAQEYRRQGKEPLDVEKLLRDVYSSVRRLYQKYRR